MSLKGGTGEGSGGDLDRPSGAGEITALAAALHVELSGIRRLGRFEAAHIDGLKYLRGGIRGAEAALFVSGVGGDRAYDTARAACRALPLRAYISVGLSAALTPGLRPGDVVVGESTKAVAPAPLGGEGQESGGLSSAGGTYPSDTGLLSLAREALAGSGARFGPLLATPVVVTGAAEKTELGREHGALALDMETAGAARAASEAGVPFLAVRGISDGLDEDLPVDFNLFMKGGGMDWPRLVLHVLAHPGTIPPLVRLGRQSGLAARNLAAALEKVFSIM